MGVFYSSLEKLPNWGTGNLTNAKVTWTDILFSTNSNFFLTFATNNMSSISLSLPSSINFDVGVVAQVTKTYSTQANVYYFRIDLAIWKAGTSGSQYYGNFCKAGYIGYNNSGIFTTTEWQEIYKA